MARRDWITKVKAPTMALRVKSGGQKHNAEIAMLSMRDWRDINNEVEENMWEILLDLFGDMTKEQLDKLPQKERDKISEERGKKLMKKFHYGLRLAMFHKSLRRWEPEITEEQVDDLISYGIEDMEDHWNAVNFMMQGIKKEDVRAEIVKNRKSEEEKTTTTSETVQ